MALGEAKRALPPGELQSDMVLAPTHRTGVTTQHKESLGYVGALHPTICPAVCARYHCGYYQPERRHCPDENGRLRAV